jgi:hypothetical protein
MPAVQAELLVFLANSVKGVVSSVRAVPVNNKEKIEDVVIDLYNL